MSIHEEIEKILFALIDDEDMSLEGSDTNRATSAIIEIIRKNEKPLPIKWKI